MGNVCLTVLCCVSGRNYLKHTLSIHPSDNAQNGRPLVREFEEETIILDRKSTERVDDLYELGRELGRGQFGVIRLCTDKITGAEFACKSIEKMKLRTQGDVEAVKREILVMERLVGHPNIVKLVEVYEDPDFVHLVMELCAGGELYDRIVDKRAFSEAEAAKVVKTLMEVVQYCHARGVMHRDIKPENILFASAEASSPIKVVDFGLALCFQPGQRFSSMAGSAYYIAPEVLKGDYGDSVDVWSAGVVLYILLSGSPPFWDETEEGVFEAIKIGEVDISSNKWTKISPAAKDLISGMLCSDAEKRLTPEQVLNSRWILMHTRGEEAEIMYWPDNAETSTNKLLGGSDSTFVEQEDPQSDSSFVGSFSQLEDRDSDTSSVSSEEETLTSSESAQHWLNSGLTGSVKLGRFKGRLEDPQCSGGDRSYALLSDFCVVDKWRHHPAADDHNSSDHLVSLASYLCSSALPLSIDRKKIRMNAAFAITDAPATMAPKRTNLLHPDVRISHDTEERIKGLTIPTARGITNAGSYLTNKLRWASCPSSSAATCLLQQSKSYPQQHPQPQSVY